MVGDDAVSIYDDRYSYHETVMPLDADDPIELLVCDRCGSVVRAVSIELHNQWHADLSGLLLGEWTHGRNAEAPK